MNLERLESELGLVVQDASLEPFFRDWINDALLALAGDIDFPSLKTLTPESFTVTSDTWLFDAPDGFHKKLFRCVDSNGDDIIICRSVADLDDLDIDHDDTGDNVTHVAVQEIGQNPQIAVYPLVNETISLWYYQRPTLLSDPSDEPDFIPDEFHDRVILPRVVVKNYRLLQDMAAQAPSQSLIYWEQQAREGLYGSRGGPLGLVQKLALATRSRRRGGRDPLL